MEVKNKHKPYLLLAAGITLAVLLITGGFSLYRSFLPGEAPSSSASQEESSESENQESLEEESSSQVTSPAPGQASVWDSAATYQKGDRVLYGGVLYQAKGWNTGEQPGKGDGNPWETVESPSSTPMPPSSSSAAPPSSSAPASSSSASSSSLPPAGSPSVGTQGFTVVAYYPSWKPSSMEKIQHDVVTHLIYAFAIPTKEGTLLPLENAYAAQSLIEAAHQKGNKVLLGVGGWSYQGNTLQSVFEQATATDEKLYRLGDAILTMCDQYGFDGVDMDWEHPNVSNGSSKRYEKLMLYLSEKLHAKGKLLTAAVLGGVSPEGTVYRDATLAHTDKVLSCVDWINVMAYDGGDGERHSSYSLAVASATYWKETRGVPANKVVLGMPFYGRPSWATYSAILAADPDAYGKDVTTINGVEVHYNGIPTIQDKTYYAKKHLGGVMVWEVTQDTADREKSLLTAIGEALTW